eukprot:TRINITY_DN52011_c0_g1_i1.p1 TRINITY_DN52011_c0_g1~~TRINITY_DN52011_c0_g1_i1.p1  ORF type:complete len:241 (-),score=13.01 TRINITY_DN52011_c0_g1_i1:52-747(-)
MNRLAKQSVVLYFDVVSPFSWFGFETLSRYRNVWAPYGVDIKLEPFFLGGVMSGSKNNPPGSNASKRGYLTQEVPLLRQYFDVPANGLADPQILFRSLGFMRVVTAAYYSNGTDQPRTPEIGDAVARAFWNAIWKRVENVTDADVPKILEEAGVQSPTTLIEMAKTKPIKELLKANTDHCVKNNAFGAPFIEATNAVGKTQYFFGSDRLEVLAFFLGVPYSGPLGTRQAKL